MSRHAQAELEESRIDRPLYKRGFALEPLPGRRPVDALALIYLGAVCLLLVFGHTRLAAWPAYLCIHLALFVVVALLPRLPEPRRAWLQFVRETYPLFLTWFSYLELARLNRLATSNYYDKLVQGWDLAIFGLHPHQVLSVWWPSPALGDLLRLCYLSFVFLIPILGLTLFFQRRPAELRIFATTATLTMYACYLTFMLFPVLGPWYLDPRPVTDGGALGAVIRAFLKPAARGTAFPSSHVAEAVMVACMTCRFTRRLAPYLLLVALGIFVGTVYGGFHYGVDALGGLAWGLAAAFLGPYLHGLLLRQIAPPAIAHPNLDD